MNVHTYHEKLLQMIAELNELQIKDIVGGNTLQANTIKQINENIALNISENGLKGELKPTVFASRPKELNEVVQLALNLKKNFPTTMIKFYIFHVTMPPIIIIIEITLIIILEEMKTEITIRVTTEKTMLTPLIEIIVTFLITARLTIIG